MQIHREKESDFLHRQEMASNCKNKMLADEVRQEREKVKEYERHRMNKERLISPKDMLE